MKKLVLLVLLIIITSCDEGDIVSTETIAEEITRGAVLRTQEYINNDYLITDVQSDFHVVIEEQDLEDGDLLDEVEVYIQYIGNTSVTEALSTQEVLYDVIPASDFYEGEFGLPRYELNISFQEALSFVDLQLSDVAVKDQFIYRLNLKLTDGRNFTTGTSSSIIIAYDTFYSSPFLYTINVVSPIDDTAYTGVYAVESIMDGPGPDGETFVDCYTVEITKGRSNTTRQFYAWHWRYHRGIEQKRRWEFNVVGDEIVFGKNQLSSPEGYCSSTAPILLGPDIENGSADIIDDTVFELWFVEGYLNFDGGCGFNTAPSRYRFTKQ